jgi:hypothetical protein
VNLHPAWIDFVTEHAGWLLGISAGTFIATIILVPILILRIPRTYFLEDDRPPPLSRNRAVHLLLMSLKNLLGLILVILGLGMFFFPGQGLLTMLIGLTIMNYPGKFKIERWLVLRPRVLPALNWLRQRYGRAPLESP